MNRTITSFIVAFAVASSACSVDNDTPTPTATTVSITPPNGVVIPGPTTSADTGAADSIADTGTDAVPEVSPPDTSTPFTVSLATEVSSATWVKKMPNMRLVAFTFTAGTKPVTLKGMTFTGQATIASAGCSFGSACARESFAKRVTSIAVYDGETQVGYAKAPDTTTGKTLIPNMDVFFPAGTSKTFVVKATLSSSASIEAPFDTVALGVEEPFDPLVLNASGESILGDVHTELRAQVASAPLVIQTIRPSGELSITTAGHPATQIVIGGADYWVPVAQYKATAAYEAMTMDRMNVALVTFPGVTTDTEDYAAIAIAIGGVVKGQGKMSSSGLMDVDLSASPITVPKDGEVLFQIWAKFASVQPWSTTSATSGFCRSGHAPALGLNAELMTGEWDANYWNKNNVRTVGQSSGERVYATEGASHGNFMVIRKSQPIVTIQTLPSHTLADVDMDLFKFQVAADSAGSVQVSQVTLKFKKTAGLDIQNLKLRRGYTELEIGKDFSTYPGWVWPTSTEGEIVIRFYSDEMITGSGNVYTLHGDVKGAEPGQNITFTFGQDGDLKDPKPVTKHISTEGVVYSLSDTYCDPGCGAAKIPTSFIWSDVSEPSHWWTTGDWTNSLFVQGLTGTVTLSR